MKYFHLLAVAALLAGGVRPALAQGTASPSAVAMATQSGAEAALDPSGEEGSASAKPLTKRAPNPATQKAIELEAGFGATYQFGQPAYPEQQSAYSPFGFALRATIAYRSPYFIAPFFALAYADLASGSIPLASLGNLEMEQDLSAVSYLPGIAANLWRVRVAATLGLTRVHLRLRTQNETAQSNQTAFSSEFSASLTAWTTKYFLTNIDVRYLTAGGADVRYLTLGLSVRGDVWNSTR